MANGKPLISANQVTFARLIAMPFVCWALFRFGDADWRTYWWVAGVLAAVVACTDFVDGFLARKYGPTVLGGLMDPIADKVFIALMYLPFASKRIDLIPVWAVILIFSRELLVTALRSSHELRDLSLKSSYFGKAKTWIQMQVSAFILLFVLLGAHQPALAWGALFAAGVCLLGFFVIYLMRQYFWSGALLAVCGMLFLFGSLRWMTMPQVNLMMLGVVLVLTWLSGLSYLQGARKRLSAVSSLGMDDYVRWSGALGVAFISVAILYTAASPWVPLIIVSCELACGGLDNLLCHHRRQSAWSVWAKRVWGTILLSGACLVSYYFFEEVKLAQLLAWGAAGVSAVGCAYEFTRGRDVYLDSSQRNKKSKN